MNLEPIDTSTTAGKARPKYQYRLAFRDGDWTIWVTVERHHWEYIKESETTQKRIVTNEA